jgi:hypothetical protein
MAESKGLAMQREGETVPSSSGIAIQRENELSERGEVEYGRERVSREIYKRKV